MVVNQMNAIAINLKVIDTGNDSTIWFSGSKTAYNRAVLVFQQVVETALKWHLQNAT